MSDRIGPDRERVERADALAPAAGRTLPAPRLRRGGGQGDGETLRRLVRDLPSFLRLLGRLARDARVPAVDKGLVLATLAYIVLPTDLVFDWIPFLGQVDDFYLLALALDRLMHSAGSDVLLKHWDGHPRSLEMAIAALDRLGSLLPGPVRALLHRKVEL